MHARAHTHIYVYIFSSLIPYEFLLQVVVCGLYRNGRIFFHPNDDEVLMETDKVQYLQKIGTIMVIEESESFYSPNGILTRYPSY